MAKIHIQSLSNKSFNAIVHFAMPAGNNSAGKSWKDCWLATGRNVTTMTEGSGVGQISTTEKASVEAGDTVELLFSFPVADGVPTAAALDDMVDKFIASRKLKLKEDLSYYGYTQG